MPANADASVQMLELLAEEAETASRPAGPCAICDHAILTGQRYALLVSSARAAHLSCIGMAAGTVARRAA